MDVGIKNSDLVLEDSRAFSRRKKVYAYLTLSMAVIVFIIIAGLVITPDMYAMNMSQISQSPSIQHIFGTDWMGRDMLIRTLKGLSTSLWIGIITSLGSCIIAVILGIAAGYFGGKVDAAVKWFIDVNMGMPHLIFLILVSVLCGKGMKGIIIGVLITHWVSLARLLRVEVMQLRNSQYIKASRSFGKSNYYILRNHIIPHIVPQFIVGVILLFPHAILHEAAVTFMGFGLSPEQPAIGVILSEAMNYLSAGMWWVAFFPGLLLVIIVRMFDLIGEQVRCLILPDKAQE